MNQIALNVDCMEYMQALPDKAFDLAIVDPPYGISIHDSGRLKKYNATETRWDDATPGDVYFSELKRCNKNQIIWGGNYYDLPPCRGFVIWDKKQPEDISFASCEFAWTSFDTSARTFYYSPLQEKGQRIHPTQKPVALYEWLLMKYAKEGWRILDTHLGSGSSRIAAYNFPTAGAAICRACSARKDVVGVKSPCVKDCLDRLPCGACRKSCEAFRAYEAKRLEEKPWVDQANTDARERYVRQSARFAKAGKRHMR